MKKLIEDIKSYNFENVYLLTGEERFLVSKYKEKLINAIGSPDDTMNTAFYEGKDLNQAQIIDLAETMPFLVERRLIVISGSGLFKSGGDTLADYMESVNETTHFVFVEEEIDKRSRLYKAVVKKGHVAEFAAQTENDLLMWIGTLLQRNGKKITPANAKYLLQKVGFDMTNLSSELEKLICYAYERDVIEKEDIDEICITQITNHIFEMTDAISTGDIRHAMDLYYDLLALKEPPMRILYMISKQYNQLLQIRALKSKGYSNKEIATIAGIHPYVVDKNASKASKYSTEALKAKINACIEAEEVVKTGMMDEKIAVELVILQ